MFRIVLSAHILVYCPEEHLHLLLNDCQSHQNDTVVSHDVMV
jgi:hypothetical protein